LKQKFGSLNDRFGMKAFPHPAVVQCVCNGDDNHCLVMRHIRTDQRHLRAFRQARAALAASGTVTLELALAGVPTVGAYRIGAFEGALVRALVRPQIGVQSVILANLVLGARVVPEFLQADCTASALADALVPLLGDTPARRSQLEAFARLDAIMDLAAAPSVRAADAVLAVIAQARAARLSDPGNVLSTARRG